MKICYGKMWKTTARRTKMRKTTGRRTMMGKDKIAFQVFYFCDYLYY
jgi:hypothetical protein